MKLGQVSAAEEIIRKALVNLANQLLALAGSTFQSVSSGKIVQQIRRIRLLFQCFLQERQSALAVAGIKRFQGLLSKSLYLRPVSRGRLIGDFEMTDDKIAGLGAAPGRR